MRNNKISDELKSTIDEFHNEKEKSIFKNKNYLFESEEVQFLKVKGHIKLSSFTKGDIISFENGAKGVIIYTDQRCFGEDARIPIINLTKDVPEDTSFEIVILEFLRNHKSLK